MTNMGEAELFNPATLPIGSYNTKLDGSGRVKLPAAVARFLRQFPEDRVFVTDLGEGFLRIFPLPVWHHNMRVMRANPDLAREAAAVMRMASNGELVDIDSQGRIVIPQRLRSDMSWEEGELRMAGGMGGSIEVFLEADYKASREQAREVAKDGLNTLLQRGMQL